MRPIVIYPYPRPLPQPGGGLPGKTGNGILRVQSTRIYPFLELFPPFSVGRGAGGDGDENLFPPPNHSF